MSANVGTIDRVLRAVLGFALIGLALSGTIGPWGYVGIVPVLTALAGWCPAYTLLGLHTCANPRRP